MNELEIQSQLVTAIRAAEEHAVAEKMSHRFKVGIPDIYMKMPSFLIRSSWWEVKYAPRFTATRQFLDGLTPHQRRFLLREQRAGGSAGLIFVVRTGVGEFSIIATPMVEKERHLHFYMVHGELLRPDMGSSYGMVDKAYPWDIHFIKRKGEPWPIWGMLHAIQRGGAHLT